MIYIQSENGLTQVTPNLTKEKIIAALGFTPADKNTFYEDESGALLIADPQGYVIARIDSNGLKTTHVAADAIHLSGEDLATKLQALEQKVPEIDLSNYYTKAEVENILTNGVDLSKYYTKQEVDQAIAEIDIPEVDLSHVATSEQLNAHANNNTHIGEAEREAWNAKSTFSGDYKDLRNAPHIVNDNEDEVVICDSQGNVILRATAEGLNVAGIFINGKSMNTAWKFTIKDKEYEVTPETQRWSDWVEANPEKGLAMSGETIYYDYVTDQWLIDVKSSDFIIPGHKYTYNTNY